MLAQADTSSALGLSSFSQTDHLDRRIVVSVSVFVVIVFGLRDLLILLRSEWPHLYGIVGVPLLRWEEVICYLPFARAFSFSNVSPIAPAVDSSLSGLSFFPPLSMFVFEFLFQILALRSLDVFLFLMHSLIPLVNFWLVYLIFRLFAQKSWALLLAFLGVCYFSSFSSVAFILNFIFGNGTLVDLASLQPPEISRAPFPGISLALFSIAFYLTVRNNRLSRNRLVMLSGLWGLQVYVYAFNFIAGVSFFMLWLFYARFITDRKWKVGDIVLTLVIAVGIIAFIAGPYLFSLLYFQDAIEQEFVSRVSWAARSTSLFLSSWGGILAYAIPAGSVLLAIYLFRGDFYELFYKFTPVFIALCVDFLIGSMHIILGSMLSPELYQHRISGILFRFLYFVPLLYFLQNPIKVSIYQRTQFDLFLQKGHQILQNILIKRRVILCCLVMILLGLVEVFGSIRYYRNHEMNVASMMQQVEKEIALVAGEGVHSGTVVYERLETNLAIPLLSDYSTLLVTGYGNYVREEEILGRLVLFAKLVDWDVQKFLTFMSPVKDVSFYDQTVLDRKSMYRGLGYWLLNHERHMNENQLNDYTQNLVTRFNEANLERLLAKYNVRLLLSERRLEGLETSMEVEVKMLGTYYLYDFLS